jgi:hypothetical protein
VANVFFGQESDVLGLKFFKIFILEEEKWLGFVKLHSECAWDAEK